MLKKIKELELPKEYVYETYVSFFGDKFDQFRKDLKKANNYIYSTGRLIEIATELVKSDQKDWPKHIFRLRVALGIKEEKKDEV